MDADSPVLRADTAHAARGSRPERSRRRGWTAVLVLVLLVGFVSIATAQRRRFFYGWDETVKNVPYDGRFTFARVRYTPAPGGNWAGGRPSWVHGYPLAEQNLMRIMREVSLLDAHIGHVALRIRELRALEIDLKKLRARCLAPHPIDECGILKGLDSASSGGATGSTRRHVRGAH